MVGTPRSSLSRRAFVGGLTLLLAPQARAASRHIAALDWVSAQNLMALGLQPVAMPEIERYDGLVVEPSPAPTVQDLGLRSEPNLELLDQLRPDLLVISPELKTLESRLRHIAPVSVFEPYNRSNGGVSDHIEDGRLALGGLAREIGLDDKFRTYVAAVQQEIDDARRRLERYDGRPLYCVTFLDGRRALVFGRTGLFQAVLDRFNIANAFDGPLSAYGHATVTIDRLTSKPEARLLSIGNRQRVTLAAIRTAPAVASLPFVRENRIALIDDILFYGGLPSVRRFARLASVALARQTS